MKQRIRQLLKRLAFLGYGSFEIDIIIRDAAGNHSLEKMSYTQLAEVVNHLEKYELLGSDFVHAYSK
jgi:hypothetical protein